MSSTPDVVPSVDILPAPCTAPLPEPTPAPHSEPPPARAPSPLVRFVPEPPSRSEPAAPPEPEPMQVDVPSDARHDLIEQIFQRVEEETARRAQAEEERSRPSTASKPPSIPSTGSTPAATVSVRDPSSTTVVRDRRRGSISVSRFGQAADLSSGTLDNPSSLPELSRKNSLIINVSSTGAFYQAQEYAGSADSFASATEPSPAPHDEGEEQVTQMETIAAKVSLGKAVGRTIARRLSRARSRDALTVPSSLVGGPGVAGGVVIGVSVEEATVEAEAEDEDCEAPPPGTPTAFVFAQADAVQSGSVGTRSRRSTVSTQNPVVVGRAPTPSSVQTFEKEKDSCKESKEKDRRISGGAVGTVTGGWVAKALDLTRRLKRRSMAVLPQNTQNSAP